MLLIGLVAKTIDDNIEMMFKQIFDIYLQKKFEIPINTIKACCYFNNIELLVKIIEFY